MPRSTTATRPRSRGLARVWKRVAELAEVDPTFQPHLEARDAIKSQLEDLAQTLARVRRDASTRRPRVCRRSKIGSRCSSGSSGSTVRRSPTSSRSGTRLSRQLDALETRRRAARGARGRDARGAGRISDARPSAVASSAARPRSSSAPEFRRCSASWRWGARSSTCDSRRSRPRARGPKPASMWPSAISRPTSAKTCGRSRALRSGGELSRVMLAIRTLAAAAAPGQDA